MASSAPDPDEDPLIAALPPVTDHLTYLTILEYRLKPHNLNVLNDILGRDDGTLANEIGWDLLRLVLPMLTEVPEDAKKCLDGIARRGNPREVVVRVAEELEKLGRLDDDTSGDDADDDYDDGLSTFAGEAARVHLGEMKLDGMPEKQQPAPQKHGEDQDEPVSAANAGLLEAAQFPALLTVLSTVHPRIKTQYPSRFLATSLPAALAAYRRMPVTYDSTAAFLQCLGKLAGKQRPALPPRQSATGETLPQAADALLPDPEAPAEAAEGTNIASQLEKDIVVRLLQAVMLEVLDEYMSSLQADDIPSMLWTKRLREQISDDKVTEKITAVELFRDTPALSERDAIVQHFLALSRTLGIDLRAGVVPSAPEHQENPSEDPSDEPSEYPTSPSQIPFAKTASLLLLAAESFANTASRPFLNFEDVFSLFNGLTPLSETPSLPNPSVQDALHSLLYVGIACKPSEFINSQDSSGFIKLLSILTQTFTITPDLQSRDDAHFIATKLVRGRENVEDCVNIIKQTILCSTLGLNDEPPVPLATPFTEGALRAIGVNWLKDSLVAHITATNPAEETFGIAPSRLEQDRGLNELIWHPSIPSPTDTQLLNTTLMALPYYIALLNLSYVLIVRLSPADRAPVLENAKVLVQNLNPWRDHLNGQVATNDEAKSSAADIYAFDDALTRLTEALAAKDGDTTAPGAGSA